jgi:hypothetical protein
MPSMSRSWLLCAAFSALAASSAQAADFNSTGLLNQAEFRAFSEDIASAVAYRGMIPSEGLGITGFDIGLSAGASRMRHTDVLGKAAGGAATARDQPVVALRAVKGLPLDIDIGVVRMALVRTNLEATGGELRWAFIGGSTLAPAVALRLSTMTTSGVPGLNLRTHGADLSISKGFALFTPYAGAGVVEVRSSLTGTVIKDENYRLNKVFAGLNIALTPLAIVIEGDKTGEVSSYGIKLAVRW